MGAYGREEILAAFRRYNEARDEASRTGDWSIWAAVFTEDADYVEHAYGEFHGRRAIEEWITKVMAPFPNMTFPQDWWALDEENDAIVFQCQNRLPPPDGSERPRRTSTTRCAMRRASSRPGGRPAAASPAASGSR
jgi:hypothetical protein